MRRLRHLLVTAALVVAVTTGVSVAASVWQWVSPTANGSASGTLGALSALKVDAASFSDAWPGDEVKIVARVTSGNTRAVSITKTTLDSVDGGDGCTKGKWDDTSEGIAVKPGDTDVQLGVYTVGRIPVSCAASDIKLNLVVHSAWSAP